MTHAWTLAVEEQFYILWPLCVFCLSRRALTVTCIAVIALANVSRIFFSLATHNAYLVEATLPCVMDSLALGAFIAILARSGKTPEGLARTGRTAAATFGILTLALVLCHGYRTYGSPNTYLLGSLSNLCLYTLLSACFAGVILTGVFGAGPTSRLLSLPFLRHIGRMSYGIYLYHLPVLFWTPIVLRQCGFSTTGSPDRRFWVKAVSVLLTYLVALASWHLIEQPCLRLKERFVPREAKTKEIRAEGQAAAGPARQE
jgi:peptidoglycan/LPS O-acetylase OafA/YrhL